MGLADEFQQEALETCRILSRQYHYNPTIFLRMIQESGAVGAAQRLLRTTDVQYGFSKLWELDKLEMSIEAMALKAKYGSLFTPEELATARKRLDKVDYRVPEDW